MLQPFTGAVCLWFLPSKQHTAPEGWWEEESEEMKKKVEAVKPEKKLLLQFKQRRKVKLNEPIC